MANWWSIYSVKVRGSSTLMSLGSTRRISDAGAGENALSPIQLEPALLLQESLSWLLSTPTVVCFLPWARSTLTPIPRDFFYMSFAKLWTGIDPIGERLQCAWWTMPATTETHWPKSTSRSSRCQWFSQESTRTVPRLASSSSLTSREILSTNHAPRLEKRKYFFIIILPSSFENVVEGVNARINKMRPSAFLRFWKHAVLGYFKYICLDTVWKDQSYWATRRDVGIFIT